MPFTITGPLNVTARVAPVAGDPPLPQGLPTASSVTRGGMSFTLGQEYPYRYSATGRPLIYAPHALEMAETSTPSTQVTGVDGNGDAYTNAWVHGMMVSPMKTPAAVYSQGVNGIPGEGATAGYVDGWNIDKGRTSSNAIIAAQESFVKGLVNSSISSLRRGMVFEYYVGHVLNFPPTEGMFSPPSNGVMPPRAQIETWTTANVNTSILPNFTGSSVTIDNTGMSLAEINADLSTSFTSDNMVGWCQRDPRWWQGYHNGDRGNNPSNTHHDYRLDAMAGGESVYPGYHDRLRWVFGTDTESKRLEGLYGLIQAGIDIAGFVHAWDSSALKSYGRADPGMRVFTVLARQCLAQGDGSNVAWLDAALALTDHWEDTDSCVIGKTAQFSVQYPDADVRAFAGNTYGDVTEDGAGNPSLFHGVQPGQEGHGFWLSYSGQTPYIGFGADTQVYQRIHEGTFALGAILAHMIADTDVSTRTLFDPDEACLRWIHHLDEMLTANWFMTEYAGHNIGNGSGYYASFAAANKIKDWALDIYRNNESLVSPNISSWALTPKRPQAPIVATSGTSSAITVQWRNPPLASEGTILETEIAYVELAPGYVGGINLPANTDFADGASRVWTKVNGLNTSQISDTVAYDLVVPTASAPYLISIRYRNANGWSAFSWTGNVSGTADDPWFPEGSPSASKEGRWLANGIATSAA